jgi:ribosomal protein L24
VEFAVVAGLLVGLIVLLVWAVSHGDGRRVSRGPGPGAAGAVYDMLNEDKRRAIEIIVEGRAEATDPETADDIPDEETPSKTTRT